MRRDYELTIQHELLRLQRAHRCNHIREIARERFARFRLQLDMITIAECNAAEAIPLRLISPLVARGNCVDLLRLHWRERRTDWKAHRYFSMSKRSVLSTTGAHSS